MKESKQVVHKPNQAIMITNGEITLNQRKAYNVVLQKAWNDLKANPNQVLFEFGISELKKSAGIKAKNNVELKEGIGALRDIKIENIKENGDWSIFSLISSAEKKGDSLVIELPFRVREALINNTYYTTLDLLILKNLEGKYSVILYEMAIRYNKKQIPEMTIDELRLLTGTEKKSSYNDFGVLRQKVLTPAIKEINSDKTDILLDYSTTTRGKKVLTIKFTVEQKEGRQLISAFNEVTATTEIMPGQMTIDEALEADPDLKELVQKILEPLKLSKNDVSAIQKYDTDIDIVLLKKYVESIKKNKAAADNPTGLLIYAIKNKLDSESITMILKSQKKLLKPSNRDNFEQREYTDEYFDNFFNNGV